MREINKKEKKMEYRIDIDHKGIMGWGYNRQKMIVKNLEDLNTKIKDATENIGEHITEMCVAIKIEEVA
tara:strand:- start:403 stop:609 length:207 start_codon:yes stop_codon:yes gene_type:complete